MTACFSAIINPAFLWYSLVQEAVHKRKTKVLMGLFGEFISNVNLVTDIFVKL